MRIVTLSSVFPNPEQPLLGLFVRERMRHVAEQAEVRVVAPVPWSPLDPLARRLKPGYRPAKPGGTKRQNGLETVYPGYFCLPGMLKSLDGWLYYRSVLPAVRKLQEAYPFDLLDVHFAYPDGMAGLLLARKLEIPFFVTLRGTEVPYARSPARRWQIRRVLHGARGVIAVSGSLVSLAVSLGCPRDRIALIPNGVDTSRFSPLAREQCRKELGLDAEEKVILGVGGLVERKGFQHVMRALPGLIKRFQRLRFLIVGGGTVEGDYSGQLRDLLQRLGLEQQVRLEGPQPPEKLPTYYSAADVFVLASSNEGWANVLLESLACGTPVVATDVGGNSEVIGNASLGRVVPYGDPEALAEALHDALAREWDEEVLVRHARQRSWDQVAKEVLAVFSK